MAMSIKAGEGVKRSDVFYVDPREVVVDWALNGREDTFVAERIARLVEDLRENGQLQPALCRRLPDKRIQIAAGYNRLRAALELIKENPDFRLAVTVQDGLNELDAFLINIRENMIRSDCSPVDTATNIRKLVNIYQKTIDEVAALYKRSDRWVNEHLKLLALPEAVRAEVSAGRLTLTSAMTVAALPAAEAEAAVAAAREAVPAPAPAPAPEPEFDAGAGAPEPGSPGVVEDEELADAIKALPSRPAAPKGGKPAPKKAPLTAEQKRVAENARKAARKADTAKFSRKVQEEAARRGAKVARNAADLKALIGGRIDPVSRAIMGYLSGESDEAPLFEALDAAEAAATRPGPDQATGADLPPAPRTVRNGGPVKTLRA